MWNDRKQLSAIVYNCPDRYDWLLLKRTTNHNVCYEYHWGCAVWCDRAVCRLCVGCFRKARNWTTFSFRNLCLKESLADWRKLFDTFVKMWSFEGDFRTKPTQSLRGASKKVLFEVGQLLFFNHPWIFFYACVIPFSTSGYLMRWWLPTLPFITAKTCNVKY